MGKFKDLTGMKFGKLTAIERTEDHISPKGKHTTMWFCKCECGKYKVISRNNLIKGITKSCGCLQKEIAHSTSFQDLTDMRFGRLTVLYRSENDKQNKTIWHCKCDCGNEVDVRATSLKQGVTQSCGCLQYEKSKELNNEIRKYDNDGNIIKKECQCCKRMLSIEEFYKNSYTADGYNGICKYCQSHSLNGRYNTYKKGAINRNIKFDLNKEEFALITSQKCHYCGEYSNEYFGNKYSGIDRVDSSIGYNINNIVPCCAICNRMKSDYNVSNWFDQMYKILKHIGYKEIENE